MPADRGNNQIGQLQPGEIRSLRPQIEAQHPLLDVRRLKKAGSLDFQIEPGEIEFPVERCAALLGDDDAAARIASDLEAEPLDEDVEAPRRRRP